jgi:hypothetical protein
MEILDTGRCWGGGFGKQWGKSRIYPIVVRREKERWRRRGVIVMVASIVPCPGVTEDVRLAKDVVSSATEIAAVAHKQRYK